MLQKTSYWNSKVKMASVKIIDISTPKKNVQEPHNGIVRFYKIANKSAVVLTLTKRSITKLFKAVSFLTVLVICKKFCKLLLVHEDYQNVPLLFLL